MNAIDPKMKVSEILTMYPETLSVFRSFNMKCAEDSSYAEKTLEENLSIEIVNFIDVLSQLDKIVHKQKQEIKSLVNESAKMNENLLKDNKLNQLRANELAFLKAMDYESSGNENFIELGAQVRRNMPNLHTINGTGKKFFGKYDKAGADNQTYRTILFFTFLYFPIFPLGCYRVKFTGNWTEKSWIIYGEEELLSVECLTVYLMTIVKIALIVAPFFIIFILSHLG